RLNPIEHEISQRRRQSIELADAFEPFMSINAGALELEHRTGEMGGWLAPACRGQGLGAELFRAGATLAHTHAGLATVRAGAEPGNTASRRALAHAGFVPDKGPPRHTLPDGRVVEAVWHRHDSAAASRCR
ncbi:GNAT family N-acetyltransferase, partial [Streptomyces sp. NPDC002586]